MKIRRFGTMTRDLQKLVEWLKHTGCEAATMESTGSYWKPVWNVLEGPIPRLILANAQHVRALPGEKTDRKDGKRLAELTTSRTSPAELCSTACHPGTA